MKQITITPELKAQIQTAVGDDVDVEGFAVFEAIAINNAPLPGKRGSIFEGAVATPLTLVQMADWINSGKTLPFINNHDLSGKPAGRVFAAEVVANDTTGDLDLRVLFYLDATEEELTAKINAGSLDEVSVAFLASQLICSECDFDYLGAEATSENLWSRTCANGHTIGEDGVHVRMVGVNQFIELSAVTRGAAKNPKIVGKSQSRLAPSTSMRLAARGFEIDRLVFQGSRGEHEVQIDVAKLNSDFVAQGVQLGLANEKVTALTASLETANAAVVTANEKIASLETELAEAKAAGGDAAAEGAAALAYLQEVFSKILVASGKDAPAELPKTVAELQAQIEEHTAKLTAILPVGGVSQTNTDKTETEKRDFSAFKTAR